MAVFKVQAPDGKVLQIEGPDNATDEQLLQAAQAHYSSQMPKAPVIDTGAVAATVMDLPRYGGMALNSALTGGMDLIVGAGQLASKVMPKDVEDRYSDYMRTRERDYQQSRAGYDSPDVGRFTGQVLAGGLATAGAAAPTLAARAWQGAKAGGSLGLMSPVDPDAGSYITAKGIQTGGGALVGAAAPVALEGIIRGTGAAINAIADGARGLKGTLSGQNTITAIQKTLQEEMSRAGVNWTALPTSMRNSLVAQVQKSLKAGGTVDPVAIKRLADFNKLNIQPTQGQITRDPLQFGREVNYSKLEPGKPLAERFTQQNQQMVGVLDDMRTRTGAKAPDSYAAGQNVINDLRGVDASRKATVDAAYNTARGQAGIEADVPLQPVAQRLGQVLEDFGDDKIPGAVMKRLQQFGLMEGKQSRVFNIREAEKLKTLIGNNIDNPGTPTGKALTLLRNSIDDAVNSLADDAGNQAAGAFAKARSLAADRFQTLDKTPGLANAAGRETTNPEKFIDAFIVRGGVDDVSNLMKQLPAQAKAEARAAVLDWIRSKSVTGVEDAAKFSQSGFDKALKAIGERKLDLLFAGDAESLAKLAALRRVGAYVQAPPIASGVNYSNTATTGADFLDQVTRLPVLNLLGRPGDMVRSYDVANALSRVAPVQSAPALLAARGIENAAIASGGMAVPMGALAVPQLLEQPNRRPALLR